MNASTSTRTTRPSITLPEAIENAQKRWKDGAAWTVHRYNRGTEYVVGVILEDRLTRRGASWLSFEDAFRKAKQR